jgi:hypothetical protein
MTSRPRLGRLLLPALAVAALALPAGAAAVDTPGTHQCLRLDSPIAMAYSATHTTCHIAKPVAIASGGKTLLGRTRFTLHVAHRTWKCTSDGQTSAICRRRLARVYMALA